MALLGHASRILVTGPDPSTSRLAWEDLGFEDAGSTDDVVRLTDGQVLLTIMAGDACPLALVYFAPSLQSVGDKLLAAGIEIHGSATTSWHVRGPGSIEWWIHSATAATVVHRSGEGSPVLGYLDGIVVPVDDVNAATEWAQKLGYLVADAWDEPAPQADLTDGLATLSFREQDQTAPYLHYTADLDDEWVEAATEAVGTRLSVRRTQDGAVLLATIAMPDGVLIMITPDL
jgi:hypothetical protein